jgi:hypothetical protein
VVVVICPAVPKLRKFAYKVCPLADARGSVLSAGPPERGTALSPACTEPRPSGSGCKLPYLGALENSDIKLDSLYTPIAPFQPLEYHRSAPVAQAVSPAFVEFRSPAVVPLAHARITSTAS